MNDEIKEILEEIDNKIIPNEHWNKIKDYIINLQKENEELKSKNDILESRMKQNDRMVICERYRILKQRDDYKHRIDKAIEYIKKNYFEEVYKTKGTTANDLLKILGGDE